ncbi:MULTISPECIES: hypothetical protein [Sphingobacterium]|uniref:Uncharacterized protein n=1 Tax=Sphingobacterium thalpophilum TaxID=259 RepID=A0A4U9UAF2_9SPHI|nr:MULTISPECIES: hypothetical protein [Sphingobacterium]MBB1644546.1 hypothetical protein [Sphingobacterium sp. UME9]MCT1533016.1 hypothetical protein [Sphingobacterium daejeonense]OJZ06461.1 MAG: hypothetical protein BGP15_04240 [Sphingobacterium sp. 40-24]VTR29533.1 Uncharacterised protein [Sphingobacterium thalpophilum]
MTSTDIFLTQIQSDVEFIQRAKRMGLETLGDIMDIKLPDLRKKKDFTYLWYADLLAMLDKRGLLEEFERRQL